MREIPDVIWDLVDKVYIELPYACEECGDLSQPISEGRLSMDRVMLMHEYLASGADEEAGDGKTPISNQWEWGFLTYVSHKNIRTGKGEVIMKVVSTEKGRQRH